MRPRNPAVLLGALIARHITVLPVDHDAIQALLTEEEPVTVEVAAASGFPGRYVESGGVAPDA